MRWTQQVWKSSDPLYQQIIGHPFIHHLMDGTLEIEKFAFYIQQDALYLAEYRKALALIASRLDRSDESMAFLSFAQDTVLVENALHESFIKEFAVGSPVLVSPICMLYAQYLLAQTNFKSVEVAVASVLPCFTVYKEVGDYILANQPKTHNRYQEWINTYAGEEFVKAVKLAEKIADRLAEAATPRCRDEMEQAYQTAFRMEWMFWDSAWRLEQWPL
jgi:thiaminase/transcriptional activator TenA